MLEQILLKLHENGIDTEITPNHPTTVTLTDINTKTVVGVCRSDSMENALIALLTRCVRDVANTKTGTNKC